MARQQLFLYLESNTCLGLEPLSNRAGTSLLILRSVPEGRALALSPRIQSQENPGQVASSIL